MSKFKEGDVLWMYTNGDGCPTKVEYKHIEPGFAAAPNSILVCDVNIPSLTYTLLSDDNLFPTLLEALKARLKWLEGAKIKAKATRDKAQESLWTIHTAVAHTIAAIRMEEETL